MSRVRSG